MDINMVRQRLYDYVRSANDKKLKAIYTIIEDELNDVADPLNDKIFLEELKKRSAEIKSGKVKTYSLEQTKAMARKRASTKKVA